MGPQSKFSMHGLFGAVRSALHLGEAATIRAHVDLLTRRQAKGWVVDTRTPSRRLTVEALQDGQRLAAAAADQPRPDLKEQGLGDGLGGFVLDFPPGVPIADPDAVVLRVVETGDVFSLALQRKKRAASKRRPVRGMFEHLTETLHASGWAWNPAEPGRRCRMEVLLDGELVATGVAGLARADLQAAGLGDGCVAFSIPLPAAAIVKAVHTVEVRADGHPLPGSPKQVDLAELARLRVGKPLDGVLPLTLANWPGRVDGVEILINGLPAFRMDWPMVDGRALDTASWTLPAEFLDSRPRLFQAVLRLGEAAVRSECCILRAPTYRFDVLEAGFDRLCAWLVRDDSAHPVRAAAFHAGERIPLRPAMGPRQRPALTPVRSAPPVLDAHVDRQRQLLDLAFETPLPGDTAQVDIRDLDAGQTIATATLLRRHEGLQALAQAATIANPGTGTALVVALLETACTRAEDQALHAVTCMPRPLLSAHRDQVAVIVPIYGGHAETVACLESVLAARNETPCELILVDDRSPDPGIRAYLQALEARAPERVRLIRMPVNRGFTKAVNAGMVAAGDRDVILLNADTIVQDGWVDRLRAAALQDPRIATATPLSNNGEIATIPEICKARPLPDAALAQRLDAQAAALNAGKVADIPVGVGFCLYIRRECLEDVGLFDDETWGKGYGEETDFCLKAGARGWRHVLAADCFVAHHGEISFGPEKIARITQSALKIAAKYPFYEPRIHRFIAEDPARTLRQGISLQLLAQALPQRRVLHVTHQYKGGTERYVQDMADLARQDGVAPLFLRFSNAGEAELSIETLDPALLGLFRHPHLERYTPATYAALREALEGLGIERMHLHSPIGIPAALLDWLTATFPYLVTVHDYAWICPRVTLTTEDSRYCGEPGPEACTRCARSQPGHPGLLRHLDAVGEDMPSYRARFGALLARAEAVHAGSRDVQIRLERHGVTANFQVAPHPERLGPPETPVCAPPAADGVVRVGLFGGLSPIKGAFTLLDCARHAQAAGLPLQFIVFGYVGQEGQALTNQPNVRITGPYQEEGLELLVRAQAPHVAFFPAQWPETYSYTLSHALRLGLWPVAPDLGAPAERVRESGVGTVYPIDATPEALCDLLLATAEARVSR